MPGRGGCGRRAWQSIPSAGGCDLHADTSIDRRRSTSRGGLGRTSTTRRRLPLTWRPLRTGNKNNRRAARLKARGQAQLSDRLRVDLEIERLNRKAPSQRKGGCVGSTDWSLRVRVIAICCRNQSPRRGPRLCSNGVKGRGGHAAARQDSNGTTKNV